MEGPFVVGLGFTELGNAPIITSAGAAVPNAKRARVG
jgi:hypothetical protein